MTDQTSETLAPDTVLNGSSPLVITANLEPVDGRDRFQPAGFPEIGHVIYKAPRADGSEESVCIVDSAASMANHLESLCMRGAHDYDLVEELSGMPYIRCVTGDPQNGELSAEQREGVVTSLTEGHRIASTYFLGGKSVNSDGAINENIFERTLIQEFGIALPGSKKAHPPAEKWWDVFRTIFKYDPNALVHGVLFPQWQIKIPRFLTAHLEAFGASRVDRSGVKFDRLGKTTSGQPIFAVDDAVAQQIRATFVLDTNLVRSFGREDNGTSRGLNSNQQEFLIALTLWKVQRLLSTPFRFRSGCHLGLQEDGLKANDKPATIEVDIKDAIAKAGFGDEASRVTDIYWPRNELYREGKDEDQPSNGDTTDQGGRPNDSEEENEE